MRDRGWDHRPAGCEVSKAGPVGRELTSDHKCERPLTEESSCEAGQTTAPGQRPDHHFMLAMREPSTEIVCACGKELIPFRVQLTDQVEDKAKPSPQSVYLCGQTGRKLTVIALQLSCRSCHRAKLLDREQIRTLCRFPAPPHSAANSAPFLSIPISDGCIPSFCKSRNVSCRSQSMGVLEFGISCRPPSQIERRAHFPAVPDQAEQQ